MVVNFRGDKIYVGFLYIHEDLYAVCMVFKVNICSAWFLDIRISTCLKSSHKVCMYMHMLNVATCTYVGAYNAKA